MNRRKSTASLGFPSLVLLGIAAVIVSGSGIGYVVMKNKQVTTRGKIAEVQKRMAAHEVTITLHQSDIDEMLGYFRLRKDLEDRGLQLREITSFEVYQEGGEDRPNQEVFARR